NLAAFAAMTAIFHRLRGGEPQRVHASLAHTGTFLQLPYMVAFDGRVWDEPNGQEAKGLGRHDRLYRASDGWLWAAGDLDLVEELAGLTEAELEERFAAEHVDLWVERLVAAGAAGHRRLDFEEVMEDERARARGLSVWREHPDIGFVRTVGPSPRLSRTP